MAITDVLRYVALALAWTLVGRALLRATRQEGLGATGWLAAPVIAQAFVALVLGMSAVVRTPIRSVSLFLWSVMVVLATAGLAMELKARRTAGATAPSASLVPVLAVALIVPIVALLPYFVHGFGAYVGTTHPDAWSYTVFGDYLWEYPRFTHGGLAPVYQWAANLSITRFVASAELGWLAGATAEGDTHAAFGLLLALSTFIIGSTCAAVGQVLGLSSGWLMLAAVAGGAGNWIGNAIQISNLDNLLALSYLPVLASLGLSETATAPLGKAVLISVIAAATIYTYPEFAPIILGCGVLYFLGSGLKRPDRSTVVYVLLCLSLTVVLVWPYAPETLAFLRHQFSAGVSPQVRPAEGMFAGLIAAARWPAALWALGAEDVTRPLSWPTSTTAGILSVLASIGLVRLVRNRVFAPLAMLALLAAGFAVFVWRYEYGYGAYKFILVGWWLAVVAVIFGVRECSRFHPALTAIAAVLATGALSIGVGRSIHEATVAQPDMADFRELRAVDRFARVAPVAIAVADNAAAHWATYFLRHADTRLVAYSGYLAAPNFQPAMAEAAALPWGNLRLLLTDTIDNGPFVERHYWRKLWSNRRYTLWDTGDVGWAVVWKIDNSYPHIGGPDLVWIGDKPVTLIATANVTGLATIHADLALSQGIASTVGPVRLLSADSTGTKCEWTIRESSYSLVLALHPGENVLTLTKISPLTIQVAAGADPQHPFMVGLLKPTVEFSRDLPDKPYCP